MKFKIEAGAEFETLTKAEATEVMQDALSRLAHGTVTLKTVRQSWVKEGNITFKFTAPTGRMWIIRRISVFKVSDTGSMVVYVNETMPSARELLIEDDGDGGNFKTFSAGSFVLQPGETLILRSKNAVGDAYARLGVREIPAAHDWLG